MLRGNAPAKIDDKGRLKIPNAFRGRDPGGTRPESSSPAHRRLGPHLPDAGLVEIEAQARAGALHAPRRG